MRKFEDPPMEPPDDLVFDDTPELDYEPFWDGVDADTSQSNIEFIQKLAKEAHDAQKLRDEARRREKEATKLYEALSKRLISSLQACNCQGLNTNDFEIRLRPIQSSRLPESYEDRQLLYEHFRKTGIYEQMMSCNSRTFNKWLNDQVRHAASEGRELNIPGVSEIRETFRVDIKKRGSNG